MNKQETLEEVANKYSKYNLTKEALEFAKTICYAFKETKQDDLVEESILTGIQWQQERSYSEEEVILLLQKALAHKDDGEIGSLVTAQGEIRQANFFSWFKQNKKK